MTTETTPTQAPRSMADVANHLTEADIEVLVPAAKYGFASDFVQADVFRLFDELLAALEAWDAAPGALNDWREEVESLGERLPEALWLDCAVHRVIGERGYGWPLDDAKVAPLRAAADARMKRGD